MSDVKDAENGTKIKWIRNIPILVMENVSMKATPHTTHNYTRKNGSTLDIAVHGEGWMTKTSLQQFYPDCKNTASVKNETGAINSD